MKTEERLQEIAIKITQEMINGSIDKGIKMLIQERLKQLEGK